MLKTLEPLFIKDGYLILIDADTTKRLMAELQNHIDNFDESKPHYSFKIVKD